MLKSWTGQQSPQRYTDNHHVLTSDKICEEVSGALTEFMDWYELHINTIGCWLRDLQYNGSCGIPKVDRHLQGRECAPLRIPLLRRNDHLLFPGFQLCLTLMSSWLQWIFFLLKNALKVLKIIFRLLSIYVMLSWQIS